MIEKLFIEHLVELENAFQTDTKGYGYWANWKNK